MSLQGLFPTGGKLAFRAKLSFLLRKGNCLGRRLTFIGTTPLLSKTEATLEDGWPL
jgi:hypothetical protein